MSLPWAAYCGSWEWPRHFQCTPTPYARSPACSNYSISSTTVYIYVWSASEEDQKGIRIPLCVSFIFFVFVCMPWCHLPFLLCHIVSNIFALVFREPTDNAILRRRMFSSPKAKSPLSNRVLTADMFSTPSTTFELPCYAAGLANELAEAPSPPPSRIRPFNKLVEVYVDIEAEEGEDSYRHGSPI